MSQGPVFFYGSEFYVLSNFSAFRLKWRGIEFDTSEAAYQWEKFKGIESIQSEILNARSAHRAFKIAEENRDKARSDWSEIRVETMRGILIEKAFEHEYVRKKLLETGDRELIEDSWRDDYWGWGPLKNGKNMLGKLWMEIRELLATK